MRRTTLPATPEPDMRSPAARAATDIALLTAAVFIAAIIGIHSRPPGLLASVWVANAVALSVFVRWPRTFTAPAAVATLLLQMSDFVGVPLLDLLDTTVLLNYVLTVPQARSWLVVAVLAAALAVGCRVVLSQAGALWLLALALLAVLPPEVELPRDWLREAFWGVLCPAGPDEPYGVLREVEVGWQDGAPRLTGRERVLPEGAVEELQRERRLGPVEEAVARLTGDPVPAR